VRFSFSRGPGTEPEWLIAGLGNPGAEYSGTRHNVGFRVADRLAESHRIRLRRERQASLGHGTIAGVAVLLVKPLTFMNLSGRVVGPLARRHLLSPARILVVYDELDLPLGRIRLRASGSAGGHNGIKSIIHALQSQEFPRIRIGVGRPPQGDAIDHVLSGFNRDELPIIEAAIPRAAEAVEAILSDGIEAAMNRFNARE
jgi:PTH1 family peptidyl-tRNA hydrolase